MIDHLIHFLGTELELNAEEVADLLWLTLEQQKKRISIEEEEPSLSEAEIAKIEALSDSNGFCGGRNTHAF